MEKKLRGARKGAVKIDGFVPVELPYYVDSSSESIVRERPKRSDTTMKPKRPKKRRRKKTTTTTQRPYYDYEYYESNYIPDEESPKSDTIETGQNMPFIVRLLNFFGMFGSNYVDYDTGERVSRIDALTVPAEITMGLIGLYGLSFFAASADLSNRKKRSIEGLLEDENSSCDSEYQRCLKLNQTANIRSRENKQIIESERWTEKCLARKYQCEKKLRKFGEKTY